MDILRQLIDAIFLKSINNTQYGFVNLVPSSSLTTISTLIATQDHKIVRMSCSGEGYGKWQLFKNTVLIETKISAPKYAIDFKFDYPLPLVSGDILDVKVEHFYAGEQLKFESTIYSIV